MLKLNLKQPLLNLSGKPIKDEDDKVVEIGKVMANAIISNHTTNDATRNYILATKFYQQDEIEFTAEDLEYVKSQIKEVGKDPAKTGTILPVIYKGQILEILDKVDKSEDGEKKETE